VRYELNLCYVEEGRPPSLSLDRLCGLVGRVLGYTTEMYCVSCEVRTEFICYVEEGRPPLWARGQSSWLQIQRSGFDYRRYHIFWEVVGLERGPLSLVSTTEELLDRKSSRSGIENRELCHRDPLRWPRGTLYPQKLALTSPTWGGRFVDIVRSQTKATEFILNFYMSCSDDSFTWVESLSTGRETGWYAPLPESFFDSTAVQPLN
jgi:hypothetical protein